jgi:molybdopterin converting factor small subunit
MTLSGQNSRRRNGTKLLIPLDRVDRGFRHRDSRSWIVGKVMKILFYGRLADLLGPQVDLDVSEGSSIAQVRDRLAAEQPGAAPALAGRRVLACVGGSIVRDDYVVSRGDQIEFLPPVSGG